VNKKLKIIHEEACELRGKLKRHVKNLYYTKIYPRDKEFFSLLSSSNNLTEFFHGCKKIINDKDRAKFLSILAKEKFLERKSFIKEDKKRSLLSFWENKKIQKAKNLIILSPLEFKTKNSLFEESPEKYEQKGNYRKKICCTMRKGNEYQITIVFDAEKKRMHFLAYWYSWSEIKIIYDFSLFDLNKELLLSKSTKGRTYVSIYDKHDVPRDEFSMRDDKDLRWIIDELFYNLKDKVN
jgi:hypothetical protein